MKRGHPPVEENEVLTSYVARADPGELEKETKKEEKKDGTLFLFK